MHDTLRYMAKDPVHRQYHHNDMTFGLLYAFSENFILPLSHDEVVHGKGSLIGNMPGDRWQRFANLRAYFGFMWSHPGKKLLFMGGEFAQEREWNHDRELDWPSLDDPAHAGVQRLIARSQPALSHRSRRCMQRDCDASGFQWIIRRRSIEFGVRVSAHAVGQHAASHCGLQYDTGAAARLSDRRATRRPLARNLQYRFRLLRRLQCRQWRPGRDAITVPSHGQPLSLELVLPPARDDFLASD